jgi:hypothetical protein
MKTLVLAAAVVLAAVSTATAETPRENAARHGDLFIPYGPQPPTAAQRRADPDLDRYPGLTPRESNTRHLTPAEQLRQGAPAPKSVCTSQWNGYSSSTVCY